MCCLLTPGVAWIIILFVAFNVFAAYADWPVTAPLLLAGNFAAGCTTIVLVVYNLFGYFFLTEKNRKKWLAPSRKPAPAVNNDKDGDADAQKKPEKTAEMWIDSINGLTDVLPHADLRHFVHTVDCACPHRCKQLVIPRMGERSNGVPRQLIFVKEHLADCDCRCLEL